MLANTMMQMEDTVDAIVDNRLRDEVEVIISSAPVSGGFARRIGADGQRAGAFQAVEADGSASTLWAILH